MNLLRTIFGKKAVGDETVTINVELSPEAKAILDAAKAVSAPDVKVCVPVAGCKVLGTVKQPVKKILEISKIVSTKAADGKVTIKGYANTKGVEDRYGDVPTVFAPLRSYVYELNQFRKNPVMLLDHHNSTGAIAGSFSALREDEVGLYFEAEFSASDFPPVAHARTVYAEGHGKALSIAGRWYFEDKDNPMHLTYAEIFEISLVGVGADPNALAAVEQPVPKAAATDAPVVAKPCCYRHAAKTQLELACATLEQVKAESDMQDLADAIKAHTAKLDESANAAQIGRFLHSA